MDESTVRNPRPGREARRGKDARDGSTPPAAAAAATGERGAARDRGGGPAQMGNALEALRIATTFFVVLYHSGLAYVATPLRLTIWPAYDAAGHVSFDLLVYWVNGFAMPLFFLSNGISAPAACEARGPRVFLGQRARRLLRPLLFACLTILPVTYLIWGYGLLVTGGIHFEDILRWRFGPEVAQHLYGLGHFWFLEYLFIVCALWCGGWTLRGSLARRAAARAGAGGVAAADSPAAEGGPIARAFESPWRPLWFALPTSAIFLVDSDTMLRVDNAIVPNAFRLLHYAYFFTVGGWVSKTRDPKARFIPHSTLYLALSALVFALMSPMLLRHAASPLGGWERPAFCAMAALFPWLTIFGGLGVLLRYLRGRGTVMRYLAESSFWLYMAHVPVVALMQILLLPRPWPIALKFALSVAVSVGVSLLSYEYIVRRSLVGEVVNGARKRTTRRGPFGPEFGWIATAAAAAALLAWGAWYSRVFFWDNNLHEEIPGQFYRSGRLLTGDLDDVIRREKLRTVIAFTGGSEKHLWYVEQKRVCEARGVEIRPVNLGKDRLPPRNIVVQLIDLIDACPRPILVEGQRGIDQSGFAAALALLLRGASPEEALREFDMRYGQFGGPEHSTLGLTLLEYRDWLRSRHESHTPERLRSWARNEYLVRSVPVAPDVRSRSRAEILARELREPVLAR